MAARAGRDTEGDGAVQRGHGHARAMKRLPNADRHIDQYIEPIAAKIRMRADRGNDEQISRLAAGLFPAPFDADAAALLYAWRDLHVDCLDLAFAIDLKRQVRPARRLLERQCDGILDVGAAIRRRPSSGAWCRSTGGAAKELLEDVAEVSAIADIEVFDTDSGA